MRARVLGNLELETGGDAASLPNGVVGALLRLFLLRPNQVLSPTTLTTALWPDTQMDTARQRLHVTLSRLRKLIDSGGDDNAGLQITSTSDGYVMSATPESMDRLAFEALAEEGLAHRNINTIEKALALWNGEPYAGFEWTVDVRTQRSRLVALHRRLIAARLNQVGEESPDGGFLRAKFRAPRQDPRATLTRSRLLDTSPAVGETTVMSVTAPAGSGKSMFLAQWALHQSVPVVWVSLDEDDNDPARFWAAVVGAVADVGPLDLGAATSGGIQAGSTSFLDAVCGMLEEADVPLGLVLDDFHLITDTAVHGQVATLVDALPEMATIAIGSRIELPFTTAKMHTAGRVHRLSFADLFFSLDEVTELTNNSERAQWLLETTEGWPVAVATLHQLDATLVPGTTKYGVGDFVSDEVLAAVPAHVAQFLMEISHLTGFTPELCDAVTGRGDAREILAWLRRHHLFVVDSETDTAAWLRLHHLVAEELRKRALTAPGIDTRELHRRAARWFLDHGMDDTALHHAVAARDRGMIAETAGDVLAGTALRRETGNCVRWLNLINPDDLAVDIRSHSIATVLASIWGDQNTRLVWAHSRRRHFGSENDGALTFHEGVVATREGRATEAVEHFERVISDAGKHANIAPDLVPILLGLASSKQVEARMWQDTVRHDDPLLRDAVAQTRSAIPGVAPVLHSYGALIAFLDGAFDLAASLAEEYYQGRRDFEIGRPITRHNSIVGALAASRHTTDPSAFRELADGMADLVSTYEGLGSHTWVALTRIVAAALYQASGDLERSGQHQRRAEALLRTFPDAPFLERFAASIDQTVTGGPDQRGKLVNLLTPREQTIVSYLASDLTSEQIARELFLSPNTVRNHASSIYRKLGVNNRHAAVLKVGLANIASLHR